MTPTGGRKSAKAQREIQAAEDQALHSAAMLDAQRGIVRLPIGHRTATGRAGGEDPVAARAALKARAEKAAAELPKTPEKPSAFE